MTPAERARQIDREEFAAECAAVRQRAYAYVVQRRQDKRDEITNWLGREAPKLTFRRYSPIQSKDTAPRPRRSYAQRHTIDSLSLTQREWADHLGITYGALNTRISRLGSLEAAVRLQSARHSGVTVAGMTKSITEWADHIGIARSVLYHRTKSEPAETLIAAYLADPPGVVSNLPERLGTGAGSTARESVHIDFSSEG